MRILDHDIHCRPLASAVIEACDGHVKHCWGQTHAVEPKNQVPSKYGVILLWADF